MTVPASSISVHIAWHPRDVPPVSDDVPVALPVQLFRLLHSDPTLLAGERCGIPTYLHAGLERSDGTAELPPPVALDREGHSVVVLLVGNALLDEQEWIDWVRAMRQAVEAEPTALLVPIALTERALGQSKMLGGLAVERVFAQQSMVERDRAVRIAVLRTIVHTLLGGTRVKVLVSHAKLDGARVAHALASYLDEVKGDAWVDVEQIESGKNFANVLERAMAEASAFVAVVSDAYATREWCRWEAQLAKQSGLSMVVLDMVTEGQRRSLPALGSVPVVRYNAPSENADEPSVSRAALVACARVMESVLTVRMIDSYFGERVRALAAHFGGTPNNWTFFGAAPDLLTVLSRQPELEISLLGVYPDPPLPAFESAVLSKVANKARLETPLSLIPELAMSPRAPGQKRSRRLRVAISISEAPAEELRQRSMGAEHVNALFMNMCGFLLAAGHKIGRAHV